MKDTQAKTVKSNGVNLRNRALNTEENDSDSDYEPSMKIIRDPNFNKPISYSIKRPSFKKSNKKLRYNEPNNLQEEFIANIGDENNQNKCFLSDYVLTHLNNCFIQDLFGHTEEDSVSGSILSFSILTISMGSLTLPYLLSITGIIPGLLILMLITLVSYWMLSVIQEMAVKYKQKSYSDLMSAVIGSHFSFFLECVIWLNYFLVMISFLLICKL